MSNGPIEFLGEGPAREVPTSEYGGDDGLIQPPPAAVGRKARVDGMDLGHELTAAELGGVLGRAASAPLVGIEQVTGESLTGEIVQDPITGRVVSDDDVNKDVTGKRGKDHGLSDGMIQ
jgi:hypothetical protein